MMSRPQEEFMSIAMARSTRHQINQSIDLLPRTLPPLSPQDVTIRKSARDFIHLIQNPPAATP
jgi:hypothetical protein